MKSCGNAQEVSWQGSRSLMARLTKSHGMAHDVSWQGSRSLMARLKKSHCVKELAVGQLNYVAGSFVWVEDPDLAWIDGEIQG
ncbi:hypothetical protein VNO80_30217 [Phaseolus coccineus]|uniref:Myosin N-terminal SH3-like domain-containing protein n=1 Tax=Phaseolus coccineus TaxID=3886 RepID=A0AAN9LFV4_PHACN